MQVAISQIDYPRERDVLYEICADAGEGGRSIAEDLTEPKLLGGFYAVPYAEYDPSLCLMLRIESRPLGYILGTDNTAAFARWFNSIQLPKLRQASAHLSGTAASAAEQRLLDDISQGMEVLDFCRQYPAHLHINILPEAQGKGLGKRLMNEFIELLRCRQVPGVHLGVAAENTQAIGFYESFGFSLIAWKPEVRFYGMKLSG